jgi:hypothetical protein
VATALGFVFGPGRDGPDATMAGVVAGVGVGLCLGAVIAAWKTRPSDRSWQTESPQSRRDRLQRQRARQLWLLPIVTLLMLAQAAWAVDDFGAAPRRAIDYVWICLPVLYAWAVALITMGLDQRSLKNRRFLEDELTLVLRARAMTAAFMVLMVGTTIALGLGLWRLEFGVMALPFALSAAGATAGIRFAWRDREAGRDE